MADWRTPAEHLTDDELREQFSKTADEFDAARHGDGHGGSPGEWAWERLGELETEFRRRGLSVPSPI